jgi:hypothetical protein
MKAFAKFVKEEPVRAMAILTQIVVTAGAFGYLDKDQATALSGLAAAFFLTSSQIVRSQVAPMAKLSDKAVVEVRQQEKAEEAKADGKP